MSVRISNNTMEVFNPATGEQEKEVRLASRNDLDQATVIAKKAFEIIISAYNQGEKKTLKGLVSKDVFATFEKAIDNKTNNPSSQFYSLVIEGVEDAKVENNVVKITLRFTSEQFTNDDEKTVIKKQDLWTFEKKADSKSPEWILTST